MSPVTHLLIGWVVANTTRLDRRDRCLVTVAGVIPDVDGLGIVAELGTRHSAHPLTWWSDYHHVLGHNVGFALTVTLLAWYLGHHRWKTAALACLSFHLHLLGDLVGARGPDGEQWPIPYLLPFSKGWPLTWNGQWALNAWPNLLITAIALALTLYWAWKRGYSPVEMFSSRADGIMVETLRRRFGRSPTPGGTAGSD